jgi:hypothetical protein
MAQEKMIVFDLESDGLLDDLTQIHCIVLHDTDTDQTHVFNNEGADKEPIVRAVTMLEEAETILGHNVIGFDVPAIRKCYPFFEPQGEVIDTLVLSKVLHPDILKIDQSRKWPRMPLQLYGRHSLESYGHRLGTYKGDFGKTTDWKEWSQEMEDYCVNDVQVTTELWRHFQKKIAQSAAQLS